MGAIGAVISAINPILGAVSAIAGIVGALSGGRGGSRTIQLPTFRIPEQELQLLKEQIIGNVKLSDEARNIALQALENYRAGKLAPVYEDLYNKWYKEQEAKLKAELARRGIPENSTIFREALARLQEEGASLKATLLEKQLRDALSVAGLSDKTINELFAKWRTEANITGQQAQLALSQASLENQRRLANLQRYALLGQGFAELSKVLGQSTGQSTGEISGQSFGQVDFNPKIERQERQERTPNIIDQYFSLEAILKKDQKEVE